MIDAATETLRAFLEANVAPPSPDLGDHWVVTAGLNEASDHPNKLLTALWRIEQDPYLRNATPHRPSGGPLHPAPLPLDLHYILTMPGTAHESALVVLSRVLRSVHSSPLIQTHDFLDRQHWSQEFEDGSIPESLRMRLDTPSPDEVGHLWNGLQHAAPFSLFLIVSAARVPADKQVARITQASSAMAPRPSGGPR